MVSEYFNIVTPFECRDFLHGLIAETLHNIFCEEAMFCISIIAFALHFFYHRYCKHFILARHAFLLSGSFLFLSFSVSLAQMQRSNWFEFRVSLNIKLVELNDGFFFSTGLVSFSSFCQFFIFDKWIDRRFAAL